MARVVVTGGSGKLGRVVVAELVEHGWEVHNLDLAAPREPVCPHTRVDLTDYGQVVEALTGIDDRYQGLDAVVHLAAIPGPGVAGNAATFANNVPATYNIFAASRRDERRCVAGQSRSSGVWSASRSRNAVAKALR